MWGNSGASGGDAAAPSGESLWGSSGGFGSFGGGDASGTASPFTFGGAAAATGESKLADAFGSGDGETSTPFATAKPVFGDALSNNTASPAAAKNVAADSPSRDTAGGETSHVDDSVFKLHGDATGLQQRVQIETGEEGSTIIFEARAKLRIFVESETYGDEVRTNVWKERGKGQLKLLRNEDGTSTLLMRQESTEKVVANYIIVTLCDTSAGNPKARTVAGMDTERAVGAERKMAKFAISFRLPETAAEFETAYNECEAANSARTASGGGAVADSDASSASTTAAFGGAAAKAPASSKAFGGGAPAPSQIKVNAFGSLATGSASSGDAPAFAFGLAPSAESVTPVSAAANPVFAFSVTPAATSGAATSGADAAASASPSRGGDTAGGETSHVDDSVFKLHGDATGLQQRVQIETGEEGSTIIFEARAKLRIFVESETYGDEVRTNVWKERGKGQLKLLRNEDGTSTLLMRQESTEKVVANYIIVTLCDTSAGNPKARTVAGMDTERAVGAERKMAKFAISFRLPETAAEFETAYNECEAANAARTARAASGGGAVVDSDASSASPALTFGGAVGAFGGAAAAAPGASPAAFAFDGTRTPVLGGAVAPAPVQMKVNAFASLATGFGGVTVAAPAFGGVTVAAPAGFGGVTVAAPAFGGAALASQASSSESSSAVCTCIVKMLAMKLKLSDRVTTFAEVRAHLHRKQPQGRAADRAPTPLMLCRVILAHFKNGLFTRDDIKEFLGGEAPEEWSARVGLGVGADFWAEARPLAQIALHALTAEDGQRI